MTVLEEYMTQIKPSIEFAVDRAFASMLDGLEDEIRKSADRNVYSYVPPMVSEQAVKKRRHMIGSPENINAWTEPLELHVQNMTELQEDEAPAPNMETTIVEEGWVEFGQPAPRPFMDEALDIYIGSGRGNMELMMGLTAAGFTVK